MITAVPHQFFSVGYGISAWFKTATFSSSPKSPSYVDWCVCALGSLPLQLPSPLSARWAGSGTEEWSAFVCKHPPFAVRECPREGACSNRPSVMRTPSCSRSFEQTVPFVVYLFLGGVRPRFCQPYLMITSGHAVCRCTCCRHSPHLSLLPHWWPPPVWSCFHHSILSCYFLIV